MKKYLTIPSRLNQNNSSLTVLKIVLICIMIFANAYGQQITNVFRGMPSIDAVESLSKTCKDVSGQNQSTYLNSDGKIIWHKMKGLTYITSNIEIEVVYKIENNKVYVDNLLLRDTSQSSSKDTKLAPTSVSSLVFLDNRLVLADNKKIESVITIQKTEYKK